MGRGRTAWLARRFDPLLTPYDGFAPAAQDALTTHPKLSRPMSPSTFQGYAECALKLFFKRVLGLRALEEPEDLPSINALDRGSLLHRILERAMAEILPADPPRHERRDQHMARIEEIAAEEFASFADRGLTGHPQLWEIDKRVMLDELRLWYDAEVEDARERPCDGAAFEVTYGIPLEPDAHPLSRAEPALLKVGDRTLELSGQMDRLQWSDDARDFVVIDYKTGQAEGQEDRRVRRRPRPAASPLSPRRRAPPGPQPGGRHR